MSEPVTADVLATIPRVKRHRAARPLEELAPDPQELVVANGHVRQAGAMLADTHWIQELKARAEQNLYVFTKSILKRTYLSPSLHVGVCAWLQDFAEHKRKLMLLPREHAKTSLVCHGMPLHILIQPKTSNLYFPDEAGCEQRIALIGETAERAGEGVGVCKENLESNELLRALWPDRVWHGNPRREARKWSNDAITIPREGDWPNPSLFAIGVGGAITGAHPSVKIGDDLATFEAANSPIVMNMTIDWFMASRALINKPSCLEVTIGTRWHIFDLYACIMFGNEKYPPDDSVEIIVKSIVEKNVEGKDEVIYPECFATGWGDATHKGVERLKKEHGVLFPLMYMNQANDPSLVDFDANLLRTFAIEEREQGRQLTFAEDKRDVDLASMHGQPSPRPAKDDPLVGMRLNTETYRLMRQTRGRDEYLRLKMA